jgi:two-component system chemotaxis response regulator CheY
VPNSASDGNSAGRKLVLIVDDHPPTREALSALLDSEGYHVLEAGNGLEALELIDAVVEPPCMIVLDLAMPVMDGREFLKARSQRRAISRIPVVVLSANVRDGQPMEGAEACLSKPTSPDSLLRILSNLC